jgi:hypothetical protein|tara:strand:+ start:1900 stop:2505 length:606 start_codon:yes stop_codon:yes gene_type:complete
LNVESLQDIVFICFGAVYCFFGYRFLKLLLAVGGVVAGVALANLIASAYFQGSVVVFLIIALLTSIIAGVIVRFVFNLAIWCVGFVFGTCLSPLIVPLLTDPESLAGAVIAILFATVTGLLAVIMQRPLLIIVTATIGAFVVMTAIQMIDTHYYPFDAEELASAYADAVDRTWWGIMLLAIAGMICQFQAKKRVKRARRED